MSQEYAEYRRAWQRRWREAEEQDQIWELLPPSAELDLVPMEDAHPELIDLIHREGELLYASQELHRPTGRPSAGTEESGPPG